jgi:2-polyprenyl-6-methoxyphenol hydroxylase-like FAD-dependent oxidoreductase
MSPSSPDVVIVGGGIGGGALATVLARGKLEVVVLERETIYPDRVRGEWVAPWGVAEMRRLGFLDLLLERGGLIVTRNVNYDEIWPAHFAEAHALDLGALHPDAPGAMCISHPLMCNIFHDTALSSGATILRGVTDIEVVAGERPSVSFAQNGAESMLFPRLVVGADGRNSHVRKQLGFRVQADPPHSILSGMLVANVPDWPRDRQGIGTEDRFHFLVFPQGKDMVRLYACYDFADSSRFSGADKQTRMLQAYRMNCLPFGEAIAAGTPAGPLNGVSNEDHWIDDPTLPGVVLIGDSAGHNDPITGQGVSITLRDVRLLSDALLLKTGEWTRATFADYVDERRERMRRLRIAARLARRVRSEFGPEARDRRARFFKRTAEGQLSPYGAVLVGPERLPADAFLQDTFDRLLAS